ncbi:MAG: hypothetical protein ACRBN8_24210 [Nannocystales bacterium]
MPHWKTAIAPLVLVVSLVSCQRAPQQSSATPQSMATTPVPEAPPRPQESTAAQAEFDIDSVASTLEPLVRCRGNEVLWGDACASAPDVLAQLADTYPIPAELLECGASFAACRHAKTLCKLPNEVMAGHSGQSVAVAELADALYMYGENGLSRKCSIRSLGGCEEFRRYPKDFPDCRARG